MSNFKYYTVLLTLTLSFAAFAQSYKHEVVLEQPEKDVIWGFDFLPDGKVVFTEKEGNLFIYDPLTKKSAEVSGIPKVYSSGQAGLLDVRVHPKNGYIYLTYTEPQKNDKSATTLARFKLQDNKLIEFKKIFQADSSSNDYHYGSRIEFMDNKVFITSGERGERPLVQQSGNYFGKIVRMNEDGSSPEVWSRGIRSPQGLALRPGTSELWEAEMGPKGGDELNIVKKDANYGWPVVTYGTEYNGPKIGEGTSKKGIVEPIVYWVPSISPSAMTFWNGDIWLALLSGQHLRRLEVKNQKIGKQEKFLEDLGWRFRNVRPGPDGNLWFSTDEGRLGRLLKK